MSEHKTQTRIIKFLKQNGYWYQYAIFAVPNGIWIPTQNRTLRSKIINRMKAEGMRPGAADLIFLVPRGGYHGMVMELKCADGGSGASKRQIDFIELAEKAGYFTAVPNGYEEAREMILEYFSW